MHQGPCRQVSSRKHCLCFALFIHAWVLAIIIRFIADVDKEWFDIELLNTVEKEFNEEVVEVIKEPR